MGLDKGLAVSQSYSRSVHQNSSGSPVELVRNVNSWATPQTYWQFSCIWHIYIYMHVYIHILLIHSAVQQKLTQHCKSVMCAKSLQSCPTLCDAMDWSPPGSSVHGILQTRILEWVAIPSSRGSSQPRNWSSVSYVSCIGRWVLYH